ncbi:hypothetical protein CU098_008627 [Rhizopus stolonifer]|uniref:Arrestin-like N-terminal domain-containing protein n=1 Tax=Rhizopus stolonifer TaxID=4846 RepID=A0A367KMJ8_RHIST|nr:hypothetical protein CU098_008627 [Rhizopus stolonifer]
MKEGFESVRIKPETNELEFIGPAKKTDNTEGKPLKGNILLTVNKATKIKSITLKFKGRSRATYTRSTDLQKFTITARIQPKLKTKPVEKTMILNTGQHTFSWELIIPNVYPRTLETKRCSINYFLELKISLGVGRSLTAECPIEIQRHLVASLQSAVKINTKCYKHTSPEKLYYEITAPRVICTDQEYFPLSITYSCFNRLSIHHVSVYLVQTEVYRIESDKKGDTSSLSKTIKYLGPSVVNYIDSQSNNTLPLLIMQKIPPTNITPGIESPLVAIYHQLDITFNLGDDNNSQTRVPIYISSTSKAFSDLPLKYDIETQPHQKPLSTQMFDSPIPQDKKQPLRKSVSEHNLCKPIEKASMSKTAGSNRQLKPINTDLANKLESIQLDDSSQAYYMSPLTNQSELSSSLSPPPRRPRKKTVSDEPLSPMMKRIPELDLPIAGRSNELTSPTLRNKLIDPYAERAIRSMSMSRSSSDNSVLSRRSSSSSSSCSSCSGPHPGRNANFPKLIELLNNRNYPEAVTSHYVSAELPPVPPNYQTDEEEDFDCLVYRDLIDDDTFSINFNV